MSNEAWFLVVCGLLVGTASLAVCFFQARRVLPIILVILSEYGRGSITEKSIIEQLIVQDEYPLTGVLTVHLAIRKGLKKGFIRGCSDLQTVQRYRVTSKGRSEAEKYFRKNPIAFGA